MSGRPEHGTGTRRTGGVRHRVVVTTGAGALLGVLVLAGCSGTDQTASVQAGGVAVTAPQPAATQAGSGGDGSLVGSPAAPGTTDAASRAVAPEKAPDTGLTGLSLADRSIVRTATLSVRVPDVLAASARASALATAQGGFVAGEDTQAQPDHPAKAEAVLTLRVPSDRLPALLTQLRALGTLLDEEQSAADVTGQVVDVQARINAQKASVARVSALMARATTLGQVVQIEGELTRRQADLESLQGQAAKLADQTALATVTATIVGPTAAVAVVKPAPSTGFGAGLSKGWHAFAVSGTWLLTAVGAVLPFALLLTPFVLLFVWLARRRTRGAGPDPRPSADAPPATA